MTLYRLYWGGSKIRQRFRLKWLSYIIAFTRWPEKQTFQTAIIVSIRKARDIQYGYAEFTDARCIAMLDHVTIYADGRMIYSFLNGSDITVML